MFIIHHLNMIVLLNRCWKTLLTCFPFSFLASPFRWAFKAFSSLSACRKVKDLNRRAKSQISKTDTLNISFCSCIHQMLFERRALGIKWRLKQNCSLPSQTSQQREGRQGKAMKTQLGKLRRWENTAGLPLKVETSAGNWMLSNWCNCYIF